MKNGMSCVIQELGIACAKAQNEKYQVQFECMRVGGGNESIARFAKEFWVSVCRYQRAS